jgi:hypothetical protein
MGVEVRLAWPIGVEDEMLVLATKYWSSFTSVFSKSNQEAIEIRVSEIANSIRLRLEPQRLFSWTLRFLLRIKIDIELCWSNLRIDAELIHNNVVQLVCWNPKSLRFKAHKFDHLRKGSGYVAVEFRVLTLYRYPQRNTNEVSLCDFVYGKFRFLQFSALILWD